jgi:hypothetical protein
LLHAPTASNAGGGIPPQAVMHSSWRGMGHALTHATNDEQVLSLAHTFASTQQF